MNLLCVIRRYPDPGARRGDHPGDCGIHSLRKEKRMFHAGNRRSENRESDGFGIKSFRAPGISERCKIDVLSDLSCTCLCDRFSAVAPEFHQRTPQKFR